MKFVQARHFRQGRIKRLRVIVWHDMEAPERKTTAEAVARYFATTSKKVSAHINADQDSAVECVKPEDTAFAAPGANADGYQIELAGYARQSSAEWMDAASKSAIQIAARAVAPVMRRHRIPAVWLTDAQLRDGKTKGMTTHAQVSRVFKKSSHTDPGKGFPKAHVQRVVQAALKPPPAKAAPRTAPTTHPNKKENDVILPNLRRGDKGGPVKALQRLLEITDDGDFGPKTERAVKSFQKKRKLVVNGTVTAPVWRSLLAG